MKMNKDIRKIKKIICIIIFTFSIIAVNCNMVEAANNTTSSKTTNTSSTKTNTSSKNTNSSKTSGNNTSKSSTNSTNKTTKNTSATASTNVNDTKLSKLEIEGYTLSPEFSSDVYEYKINVDNTVNSLKINCESDNKDNSIEVDGNNDFVEGENTVTILVYSKTKEDVATYQITVNKEEKKEETLAEEDTSMEDTLKKAKTVRIILISGCVIFLIVVIGGIVKINKIEKNEYSEDDDDYNYEEREDNFEDYKDESYDETNKKGKHF